MRRQHTQPQNQQNLLGPQYSIPTVRVCSLDILEVVVAAVLGDTPTHNHVLILNVLNDKF